MAGKGLSATSCRQAASAAFSVAARSASMVRPASMAMPRSPANFAPATVIGAAAALHAHSKAREVKEALFCERAGIASDIWGSHV